jgi:pimeloyl-ACP methyl ester carboxylesterase
MVPAYMGGSWNFDDARKVVSAVRPNADILLIDFPSHVFSNADPAEIASELNDKIDSYLSSSEGKNQLITLVGFSMGALLVRKAFVYGCGEAEDDPAVRGRSAEKDWVQRVDRIVLLAGTNRGWSIDPVPRNMGIGVLLFIKFLVIFGRLSRTVKMFRAGERGEPFVADLRVQWMRMARGREAQGKPMPVVIQLLGTVDDFVTVDDNKDVTVAQDFIFLPVHGTGHQWIVDFQDPDYGRERAEKFRRAIEPGEEALARLKEQNLARPIGQDSNVTTVVYLLHGIRDMAAWTDELEVLFQEEHVRLGGDPKALKIIKSSYGYFPMGPFLLYSDRRKNIRWFMDEYTEAIARYPNAKEIHFVGHSNGTYILASALERYRTLRVDRVAFAGSVVPRAYDWRACIARGQVEQVRNYVGSSDWVVGIFPRMFELCGSRDIGSAGFNGFLQDEGNSLQVKFIPGGHSAAIDERNHHSIVNFILCGSLSTNPSYLIRSQPTWAIVLSRACWLVWLLIGASVFGVGYLVWNAPVLPLAWHWAALAAYAVVIVLILYTA